jgi:isopenicillin-N N-acyltransferase-like protein
MTGELEKITLSGTPEEIGFQHGEILVEQIHRNIEFYKPLFLSNLSDEARVLQTAERFKEQIRGFNSDYITEIDHIALGAEVEEPLWLYALNSRTELTLTKTTHECTAVVLPQHNQIGQTWDWSQHLEDSFVVMEIQFPSGHKILQVTEAGIIGKIGMNNQGLGQTLNILWMDDKVLQGVPVHVLLRAILESTTLEDAKEVIDRSGRGKASNIIVAQSGRAFDVEFAGEEVFTHDIQTEVYAHTNHYLHSPEPITLDQSDPINSLTRYQTAMDSLSEIKEFSTQALLSVLSDQSNGEYPILRKYKPDEIEAMGCVGTLATIVMDVESQTMKVRKGNPSSPAFSIDNFIEFGF